MKLMKLANCLLYDSIPLLQLKISLFFLSLWPYVTGILKFISPSFPSLFFIYFAILFSSFLHFSSPYFTVVFNLTSFHCSFLWSTFISIYICTFFVNLLLLLLLPVFNSLSRIRSGMTQVQLEAQLFVSCKVAIIYLLNIFPP